MNRRKFGSIVALGVAGSAASACVGSGDGVPPDLNRVYFPVALALTGQSEDARLIVLNSDFDLQFNRGTVQSFRLDRLREIARRPCNDDTDCGGEERCDTGATEENEGKASFFCVAASGETAGVPCGPFPENTPVSRGFSPGRCGPVDVEAPQDDPEGDKESLLADSVLVSAFGTDLLRVRSPDGAQERLFVPVRGDASVQWLNIEGGRLRCGQSADSRACSDDFRVKTSDDVQVDNLQLVQRDGSTTITDDDAKIPPEPYGIAASDDGQAIVMTHLNAVTSIVPNTISGRVSSILNRWGDEPRFVSVQAGLPLNPIGVAAIPLATSDREAGREPGFLVSYRSEARLQLLRFYDDGAFDSPADEGARPFVRSVDSAPVRVNSSGLDSRGIVVDDYQRKQAESACDGDPACLREASEIPLEVFVANRSPASLLLGRTRRVASSGQTVDVPSFYDNITLTEGPSRVFSGFITNPEGVRERRIFVLCFDSSSIFVIHPEQRRIESQFATGRGPQALAFDPERPMVYVAHFTDSYLGVLSLDQRYPQTYGAMLAMVGTPTRPRATR